MKEAAGLSNRSGRLIRLFAQGSGIRWNNCVLLLERTRRSAEDLLCTRKIRWLSPRKVESIDTGCALVCAHTPICSKYIYKYQRSAQ